MYILDTDHLSLIQRNGQEGKQILTRLSTVANLGIAVTVITYEFDLGWGDTLSIEPQCQVFDRLVIPSLIEVAYAT